MPVRSGVQYIQRLQEEPREVWLDGKRVGDVTSCPELAGAARTVAQLYDMQCREEQAAELTYPDTPAGGRTGLSFIIPRTREELQARGRMHYLWSRSCAGMLGRSPDFLNVNLAAWSAAAEFFSGGAADFGKNIRGYYDYVKKHDLALTHSVSSLSATGSDLRVLKETDAGLIVSGVRNMATLAPLSDEVVIYAGRMSNVKAPEKAFMFALPISAPGLKVVCRNSFAGTGAPLASRFEEMDALLFFENVLVPWERVFLLRDPERVNRLHLETNSVVHSAHQTTVKAVAKLEFILGAGMLAADTYGTAEAPHIHQILAELISFLETIKALRLAAEAQAQPDKWGVMAPAAAPLEVARVVFMEMYPRAVEIIKLVSASNLMILQSQPDFDSPVKESLGRFLAAGPEEAQMRVALNHLLWDLSCSAFGSRQELYERFYAGGVANSYQFLYRTFAADEKRRLREYAQQFLQPHKGGGDV